MKNTQYFVVLATVGCLIAIFGMAYGLATQQFVLGGILASIGAVCGAISPVILMTDENKEKV